MTRATGRNQAQDGRRTASTTTRSTSRTAAAVNQAAERPSSPISVTRGQTAITSPASSPARGVKRSEPSTTTRPAARPQASTEGSRRVRVEMPTWSSQTFIDRVEERVHDVDVLQHRAELRPRPGHGGHRRRLVARLRGDPATRRRPARRSGRRPSPPGRRPTPYGTGRSAARDETLRGRGWAGPEHDAGGLPRRAPGGLRPGRPRRPRRSRRRGASCGPACGRSRAAARARRRRPPGRRSRRPGAPSARSRRR